MSEKLYIKNFAGIREAEFDINKINILIGPQATGKSVVAKLLYLFNEYLRFLSFLASTGRTKKDLDSYIKYIFNKYFRYYFSESEESFIKYELNEENIIILPDKRSHSEIKINSSLFFSKIFKDYRRYSNTELRYHSSTDSNVLQKNIDKAISDKLGKLPYKQVFIPAGRSYFAILEKNIFEVLDNIKNYSIDPFITEFGALYGQAKEMVLGISQSNGHDKQKLIIVNIIDKKAQQVLTGSYKRYRDKDYIVHIDGRVLPISMASSGQQEALPLFLTFNYLLIKSMSENTNVIIEEPEAHLFPESQKSVIEVLASIFNLADCPLQFFITTHSPYILTSFNNLIEAGIVQRKAAGDKEKLKKLYEIVPKEQVLNPEDVSAWTMVDGTAIPIMDKDTGLINGDAIDDVSDETAEQFGKLLDLE